MSAAQPTEVLLDLLNRLVGDEVAELQVTGVNSLKSVTPSPSDLVGLEVTRVAVAERIVTIEMETYTATVDLQRVGRLKWLDVAERAQVGRAALPTLRLLLRSGAGLDFSEPGKTKRISVTICVD